jgi:hypothetical protein
LVDSAEEIHEKCNRPGSIPMCSNSPFKRVNFLRA